MADEIVNLDVETVESPVVETVETTAAENEITSEEYEKEQLAEILKEEANKLYNLKQYDKALTLYNNIIDLCPEIPRYYGNRSACYMMIGRFKDALSDAKKCIQMDPKFLKAYIRIVKCSLILGDIMTAESTINKIIELDPTSDLSEEKRDLAFVRRFLRDADAAYDAKDYTRVIYCMDRCCDVSKSCPRFKLMKAECLVFLKKYKSAQDIANDILHIDKQNADAIYVRGMCLYYEDNIDNAFAHFQQVLRLAPDHSKALDIYKRAKSLKLKKEKGNEDFKNARYQEAYNLYTEALLIDPQNSKTNAKLYFNKAMVSAKLSNHDQCIKECTQALRLDGYYLKAVMRRAASYMELEQFDKAVCDYEKLYRLSKTPENKQLLVDAEVALKNSKRKDYYKILGVDKNASTEDIKKAYRKRAMVHHPDRHAGASAAEMKEQEKKFKEVGEAYGILSDPKKRLRYDNGHSMEDVTADFKTNPMFYSFYTNFDDSRTFFMFK